MTTKMRPYFFFLLLALVFAGIFNFYMSYRWHHRPAEGQIADVDTYLNIIMNTPPSPSWSGAYLASRFAQSQFDWARARDFLKSAAQEEGPDPAVTARRLMLLAMGTGDLDTARAQAKYISVDQDDTGLVRLLNFIDAVQKKDFARARAALTPSEGGLQINPVLRFARPMLIAWIDAQSKSLSPAAMAQISSPFQRVLIADYLGQVSSLIRPEAARAWAFQITALNAQHMGDIFLRAGMYDTAALYYNQSEKQTGSTQGLKRRQKAAAEKTATLEDGDMPAPRLSDATQGVAAVFFDMATTFYLENGIESAQLFANMALALNPDLTEARLMLGHLYAQNSRLDQAIDMFKTIPVQAQHYRAVQKQIADLYLQKKDPGAAVAVLEGQMASATPGEKIDLTIQIGDIYRDGENFARALDAYNTAIDSLTALGKKPDAELLYARGMTLERLQKWSRAEIDLKAALALAPNHPYIMNYLGYSWADQGVNLNQALDLLQKASAEMPDDGAITDSLGWTYYRLGRYDEAITALEQASQLMPYDATVNDHLGDAYWRAGRHREARFQWERALNADNQETDKEQIKAKIAEGLKPASTP